MYGSTRASLNCYVSVVNCITYLFMIPSGIFDTLIVGSHALDHKEFVLLSETDMSPTVNQ